jgi:hypothetical protein
VNGDPHAGERRRRAPSGCGCIGRS